VNVLLAPCQVNGFGLASSTRKCVQGTLLFLLLLHSDPPRTCLLVLPNAPSYAKLRQGAAAAQGRCHHDHDTAVDVMVLTVPHTHLLHLAVTFLSHAVAKLPDEAAAAFDISTAVDVTDMLTDMSHLRVAAAACSGQAA
jgi:hypothetical protein